MKTLFFAAAQVAGLLAGCLAAAQGPTSFAGYIVYGRTSAAANTVWVNNGAGADQLLTTGFAPKPSPNYRYLLLLKNTPTNNPFYGGSWVRRRAGSAAETVVFASSDYIVGYDYVRADSSVVVSYTCAIYHNTFANVNINNTATASCYDDGPDIRQSDSLVAFHNSTLGCLRSKSTAPVGRPYPTPRASTRGRCGRPTGSGCCLAALTPWPRWATGPCASSISIKFALTAPVSPNLRLSPLRLPPA